MYESLNLNCKSVQKRLATEWGFVKDSPVCNPHPKAPHGFNRNASHGEDRYVCECESWDPYDAGYQEGLQRGLNMESKWVGLTTRQIRDIVMSHLQDDRGYDIWCDGYGVADSIEKKLKELNHG